MAPLDSKLSVLDWPQLAKVPDNSEPSPICLHRKVGRNTTPAMVKPEGRSRGLVGKALAGRSVGMSGITRWGLALFALLITAPATAQERTATGFFYPLGR